MRILVLSTWFPYPLNQGSKIRAYHLIRALSRDNQILLISFEDLPVKRRLVRSYETILRRNKNC